MGLKRVLSLHIEGLCQDGGVWIYNTACHSTEILVSIGPWVTGIQLVSAHWSLVMQAVLAPPLSVCLLSHD